MKHRGASKCTETPKKYWNIYTALVIYIFRLSHYRDFKATKCDTSSALVLPVFALSDLAQRALERAVAREIRKYGHLRFYSLARNTSSACSLEIDPTVAVKICDEKNLLIREFTRVPYGLVSSQDRTNIACHRATLEIFFPRYLRAFQINRTQCVSPEKTGDRFIAGYKIMRVELTEEREIGTMAGRYKYRWE